MTDSNTVEENYNKLALKLEHYRQKFAQQEDQIADLRVEVTQLTNKLNEANGLLAQYQAQPQANVSEEILDAEVVGD